MIGFIYYIDLNVLFVPFLEIKTDAILKTKIEKLIKKGNSQLFFSKASLERLPYSSIDSSITQITLHRKFFLIWDLSLQKKISFRYILINNQMRVLDQDSNLLSTSVVKEEIQKQVPFILKIQISQIDSKENKQKTATSEPTETKSFEQNSIKSVPAKEPIAETLSEIDLYKIYQSNIKPFVEHLYESNSSLGPKISGISYSPKFGLSFILFEQKFICGMRTDFSIIEQYIETCQVFLRKKKLTEMYTEFDFRYKNQIICRKNQ